MHGNPAFPDGLTFVDCFAGTGVTVCTDEDGNRHRYPGSTLIAASIKPNGKSFTRIFAIEKDTKNLETLGRRLTTSGFDGQVRLWNDDFNIVAADISKAIPMRSLNVAFVDPYSLDAHFAAIETLARARPLDLVILFSDRIDLQRNVEHTYYPQISPKLDEFLGSQSNWRKSYDQLVDRKGGPLREMFSHIYLRQLKTLGYGSSDSWPLEGPQGPMFRLVFASKNKLGLKYCDIARKEDFGGEMGLYD